jgi:hypothetical protein
MAFADTSFRSQGSGEYGTKFSRQPYIRSSDYILEGFVKPSAQPSAALVGRPANAFRAGMASRQNV